MDYQNVTKDKCLDEFMRLKSCVQVSQCIGLIYPAPQGVEDSADKAGAV
jgi:hypothetical protein